MATKNPFQVLLNWATAGYPTAAFDDETSADDVMQAGYPVWRALSWAPATTAGGAAVNLGINTERIIIKNTHATNTAWLAFGESSVAAGTDAVPGTAIPIGPGETLDLWVSTSPGLNQIRAISITAACTLLVRAFGKSVS